MAYRLGQPLITIACHEDSTAADLVGRYLLDAEGTGWQDGPLTLAAHYGAICYLDEIVWDTAARAHLSALEPRLSTASGQRCATLRPASAPHV